MNKFIKDIITNNKSNEEQLEALTKIEEDIAFAKEIIEGKWKFCEKCNDFYLAESFISWSGNESCLIDRAPLAVEGDYVKGVIHNIGIQCPKGHPITLSSFEEELKEGR